MLTIQAFFENNLPQVDKDSSAADLAISLFRELDPAEQTTYLSGLRTRVNTIAPASVPRETVAETIS